MRSLKNFGIASGLGVMLSVAGCSAQGKPVGTVRMASPPELAAVHGVAEQIVVSAGAKDVHFDDKQAIRVDGAPGITVLPLRFKVSMKDPVVEGQTLSLCGVVIAPQTGSAKLLETLGTGNTEMMTCTGLKAVGGSPAMTSGTRPDLILIYDAYTGNENMTATILLTWQDGTYAVDDALSQWLGEQKEGRTVAGARRLLAAKRHGKSGTS